MDDIVGVVCGGGLGTRIFPASAVTNKHLNPLGVSIPMIAFPLLTLQNAGIKNVCLISGPEHSGDFSQFLGDGHFPYLPNKEEKEKGIDPPNMIDLNLVYKVQAKPGGIAEAILMAEDFVDGRPFVVILGDNVLIGDSGGIRQQFDEFRESPDYARILLTRVEHPEHYGIAVYDDDRLPTLIDIVEKPTPKNGYEVPPSDMAVIGVYMYPSDAFDRIRGLKPSLRGELEITDLNLSYLHDHKLEDDYFSGTWIDAGEHQWSLLEAGLLLAQNWNEVISCYPTLERIAPPPPEILKMIERHRNS